MGTTVPLHGLQMGTFLPPTVYKRIHCYNRVGDHESMFSPELVPLHAPGEI